MKLLVLLISIFQGNCIRIISYGILYNFYRNHYNMYKRNVRKFGRILKLGIRLGILRYVILNCFNIDKRKSNIYYRNNRNINKINNRNRNRNRINNRIQNRNRREYRN
jgi:hypothetical protein